MLPKTKILICCCCGMATRGRQWWNRDTGYGLCNECIDYCHKGISDQEMENRYGKRGIHYDLPKE